MFTHTSDSRMQLLGVGDLRHPGACMVCGSGTREQGYVNLGVYYEYEGNMYLCFLCLTEAAEIIGMLTSEEALDLRNQAGKVFEENARLKEELANVNQRLTLFNDAMRSIAVSTGGVESAVKGSSKGEGSVPSDEPDVSSGSDVGESVAEEPVKSNQSSRISRAKRSDTSSAPLDL